MLESQSSPENILDHRPFFLHRVCLPYVFINVAHIQRVILPELGGGGSAGGPHNTHNSGCGLCLTFWPQSVKHNTMSSLHASERERTVCHPNPLANRNGHRLRSGRVRSGCALFLFCPGPRIPSAAVCNGECRGRLPPVLGCMQGRQPVAANASLRQRSATCGRHRQATQLPGTVCSRKEGHPSPIFGINAKYVPHEVGKAILQ